MTWFTEEEKKILAIYNEGNRLRTLERICHSIPYVETQEMRDLVRSSGEKLAKISERTYQRILESAENPVGSHWST